ncbi:MAG: hypothetical protein J4F45_06080 [Pseudomonadales bacterium]|nr:hypothetical protein [Pseudomonadales bacterium]
MGATRGLVPAIALFVAGCAGDPTAGGVGTKARGTPPPAVPEARVYAMPVRAELPADAGEAQRLLAAANIVGGLWRISIDASDWRGHESITRGTRWMTPEVQGAGPENARKTPDPRLVEGACSAICPFAGPVRTTRTSDNARSSAVQDSVFRALLAARKLLKRGEVDRVANALDRIVRDNRVTPSVLRRLRVAGGLKQSRRLGSARLDPPDRAALLDWLANARLLNNDLTGAVVAYEGMLELADSLPSWRLDGTRERLAHLNFALGNYEESLAHQRAWLRQADWVGQACPKVCDQAGPPGASPHISPGRLCE